MAQIVTAGGLAAVVIGSFGPWLRSGRRLRSSYELLQVAERLGFLGDGVGRLLPRTWVFVPLAAALALVALLAGWRRLGGTVALVVGVYAVVLSAGVLATSLVTEWGTMVVAAGGCLAAIGGSGLLLQRTSRVSA